VLYGEILEVGRNLLAMHPEEAQSLLPDRSVDETSALLSVSDGWPALIGLATLSRSVNVPGEALPEELYGFFAE
jgi:ATP/maltotriose-dependent transcriptional regulator MalT